MRLLTLVSASLLLFAASATADEIQSGVQVGGGITTYSTTKCGGANDGVKVGASLCYT